MFRIFNFSLTWMCQLWCKYFSKTGVISSNTIQVVRADSFPLPPNAEVASKPVKGYQNRSPALWFSEMILHHEVVSIFYLSQFQTPSITSPIRIVIVRWNRIWLLLLYPSQPYQPELPCDLLTRVLSHGKKFLCLLLRGYKGSIKKVNNLPCLLR